MSNYKDLREFLALLEAEKQLVRIKDEVMPEPDLSAIGRAECGKRPGGICGESERLQKSGGAERARFLAKPRLNAESAERYAGERAVFRAGKTLGQISAETGVGG
ncbi:hypothetical protein [Neisseria perflava]|uniref:hypothetical protein n=1 Tax=Neisseria perflava TaxID=33053 RepID=UPI003F5A3882|nr:hypothetical protein [Neisseria perflava]